MKLSSLRSLSSIFLLFLSFISPLSNVVAHWPHDTVEGFAASSDGRRIFAVVRFILFESTDNGESWKYVRVVKGSPTYWYLAVSPYGDEPVYMLDGDVMERSTNLWDWETLDTVNACHKLYLGEHGKAKRRTTFVPSGAIISGEDRLYKEDGNNFIEIVNGDFTTCPAVAGVPGTETVYASGVDGLMRNDMGGIEGSWELDIPIADEIIDIEAIDNEVFVLTTESVCRVDPASGNCIDVNLPPVPEEHKVHNVTLKSYPTDFSFFDGTLIVTRSNSYAVYFTSDFGATWQFRSERNVPTDFATAGHSGLGAWEFESADEFTHADANHIGSWKGIFTTNDHGNSWTNRDTIRKAITYFSLIKNSGRDDFTVSVCTYAGGCYMGPPDNLQPLFFSNGFYNSLHLSPTYEFDGIGFKNERRKLRRLDDNSLVSLPSIDDEKISIKGMIFPPNFNETGRMFVYGYSFGVRESTDYGRTFDRRPIFSGKAPWDVVRMVISPNFAEDGVMACLVDPDFDGKPKGLGVDMYIYVSSDDGVTWRRAQWKANTWRDLIIVAGSPDPIIVALHEDGRMYTRSSNTAVGGSFQRLTWSNFRSQRPQGYGNDGLAVSPDGATLAASFEEGGVLYGEVSLFQLNNRSFSSPNPWKSPDSVPKIFAKMPPNVDDVQGRTFSSHIAFSPDYANDRTLFAADMFSIYKSTNKGRDWELQFSLQGAL